jgi:hypothetical protein
VDRILREKLRPDAREELISIVENDQSLSNPQADEIYDPLAERGPHPFSQFVLTPHAQYRMDLRGVTVKDLKESLLRFMVQVQEWKRKNDPRYAQLTQAGSSKISWEDPRSGLFFVFGFGRHDGTPTLITTYWKGERDPSIPSEGCQSRQAGHSAPAGGLFGIQTFISEKPAKGIEDPSGDSIYHPPGESPKSDRDRAKPQRTDTKDNLTKHPPKPPVFNTPGPSEPGNPPIKVRSPGTPGEEYGHPYKENVYPRRTEGSFAMDLDEVADTLRLAGLYPSFSQRQHKQKGQAKRYYQRYYRAHKGRAKTKAKRRYKRIHNSPAFKRRRRLRNNPKFKNRFRRLPAGGARSTSERAKNYRKRAMDPMSFFHLSLGWGDVIDFNDEGVVVHLDGENEDPLTVPLQTFIRGAVFESEETTDAFFNTIDEVYGAPDPRAVVTAFYRETFTPGYNMDPGDGVRDLGLPGPEDVENLGFYEDKHDKRAPGHKLDIREFDGGGGSAKVIPSGHDFANKEASRVPSAVRVAKRLAEMLEETSGAVIQRSTSIHPKGKRFDPKNSMFSFSVPGSGGKTYTVRIKVIRKGNATKLSKMHLLVSCSCEFWRWQGPEHHAMKENYLYGKPRGTASIPHIMDPKGKHRVCKHLAACLNSIKEWELAAPR